MFWVKIGLGALVVWLEYIFYTGYIKPVEWLRYNKIFPRAVLTLHLIHYGILGTLSFFILGGLEFFAKYSMTDIVAAILAAIIVDVVLLFFDVDFGVGAAGFEVFTLIGYMLYLFWKDAIQLFCADFIAMAMEFVIALVMYKILKLKQDQLEKEEADRQQQQAEKIRKQAEEWWRQKEERERKQWQEKQQKRSQLQNQIDDLNKRIYAKKNALFSEVSKALVNQKILTAATFNQLIGSTNRQLKEHGITMTRFLQDLLHIFDGQSFSFTDEQREGLNRTLAQLKGQAGEEFVASYLSSYSDCIVLRSLDIPFKYGDDKQNTNQIDLLCLMPSGIYILEVKNWISWYLVRDSVFVHWAKKGNNKLVFEYPRGNAKPLRDAYPQKDGQRTVVDQINDHVQAVKDLLENNGMGELTKYVNGWLVIGTNKSEKVTIQSVPGSPQIYLPEQLYAGMTQEKEMVLLSDQLLKIKQILLANNHSEKKYSYTYLIPSGRMLKLMYDGDEHRLLRMINDVDILEERLNSIE